MGHLLLAEGAARAASLDRVLFMPAHIQPFKQGMPVTTGFDRVEMLRLAINGNAKFEITDVELLRGGVSYTIDSLRRLRDGYCLVPSDGSDGGNGTEWSFIVGADMFLSLGKWKEYDSLMKEFSFVVGRRPGYLEDETASAAKEYEAMHDAKITVADNTWMDVSSSEIRRRVVSGESIRYMTPDSVAGYIAERGLYGYKKD
jgi:nicotinate-nucleotide adenylyltransferase